jgi:RecA/RadA recombinase
MATKTIKTRGRPAKASKEKPAKKVKPVKKQKQKIAEPSPSINLSEINKKLATIYSKRVDAMEKQFSLTSAEMSIPDRLSTGTLVNDFVTGGGLVAGTMVQISGKEGSGKSTTCMTSLGSAINAQIPIIGYWDAENSLNDPRYAKAILKKEPSSIFFGKDRAARLYQEAVLEDFYGSSRALMRSLPDKYFKQETKQWYFVFDRDDAGRKQMHEFGYENGSNDKNLFQETGRLWCPTEAAGLQGILYVDSYPALVTSAVDESDDEKNAMAIDARAFSKNIKRIKGILKRKAFVVFGINQIRLNPGARFGCLHGDTPIPLCDGTSMLIKDIVKNKAKVKIWSYNEDTHKLEAKKVVDWFVNGSVESPKDWVTITTDAVETKNGFISVTVTPCHQVMTKKGWKRASKLKINQDVLSKYTSIINGTLGEFLYGVFIGDSTIVVDSPNAAHFRLRDNQNQEYVDWKCAKLTPAFSFKEWKHGIFASTHSYELSRIAKKITGRNPTALINRLTPLSIAIHYMDDGHLKRNTTPIISYKRFRYDTKTMQTIANVYNNLGFKCSIWNDGVIAIDSEYQELFFKAIRTYICKPMQYKLPEKHQWVTVKSIEQGSDRKFREKLKYDIKVQDNHCYLAGSSANGILLHNSPEYEPLGEALKFNSDCRIQSRPRSVPEGWSKGVNSEGKGTTSDYGTEPSVQGEGSDYYRYVYMQNTKNKTSIPHLGLGTRIWFRDYKDQPHGYDPVYDTYQYLRATGRIEGGIAKFKVTNIKDLDGIVFKWLQFKLFILANELRKRDLLDKLDKTMPGLVKNKLRHNLFAELHSGKAMDMISSGKRKVEDLEIDE